MPNPYDLTYLLQSAKTSVTLSNTTPAAPIGLNVQWQTDEYGHMSAYVQTSESFVEEVIIAQSFASYTFSSLPQNFKNLDLQITGAVNQGGTVGVYVQFNSDTGDNYNSTVMTVAGTSVTADAGLANALILGYLSGSGSYIGAPGSTIATIFNYSSATYVKNVSANSVVANSPGVSGFTQMGGTWGNRNPITSITVFPEPGNTFAPDTVITLYGKF